jgi:hypothetical protein
MDLVNVWDRAIKCQTAPIDRSALSGALIGAAHFEPRHASRETEKDSARSPKEQAILDKDGRNLWRLYNSER